jgi:DNA-binding CsgD family transcriptional regulator
MTQIRKFIEWMSFHPTTEEIARALATDYLAEFGVQGIRFGRINSDDSVIVLGSYGYPNADLFRGRSIPSAEWRAIDAEDGRLIASGSKEQWTPSSKWFVNTLRDHGVIQGHLVVEFTKPVPDSQKQKTAEAIDDLCIPIALYLSFQNRGPASNVVGINSVNDSRDSGTAQLSARQLSILRGMVEGKTNHELATELGFSVSTIRHETMRIYQALSVSDRKEAAKKALMLGMI